MTETADVTKNHTRKRLRRGGLALVGVAAVGALATLTASQWSDETKVEDRLTTGTFEITISDKRLGFDEPFAPGDSYTYEGVLTNSSTEPANITLIDSVFPDAFAVSVTADGTSMFDGGVIDLEPRDAADVVITFTLPETTTGAQGLAEEASFTFLGEQQLDDEA